MEDIRRFEFNTVYVIESLNNDDKQTGEILFNNILNRKTWQISFLNAFLKKVNSRYYFLLAETIFEYVHKDYEQRFYQPKALEERINRLIAERRKNIIIRQPETLAETRKYIEKNLIDDKEERKAEYKRRFLLME